MIQFFFLGLRATSTVTTLSLSCSCGQCHPERQLRTFGALQSPATNDQLYIGHHKRGVKFPPSGRKTPIPESCRFPVLRTVDHAQIPDSGSPCPVRLLAVHRDRDAGLRAGAGGFHSGANSERPEHLRPGGRAAEARPIGAQGYPDYKAARGLRPIRDWTWSGHTLRCLKVLTAMRTAR